MAARLNPEWDARTRQKIQATQIINRLQSLVNGEIEMPPHAVTAGLGLLKKAIPDLSAVTLTGADGGPVLSKMTVEFVRPDASTDT